MTQHDQVLGGRYKLDEVIGRGGMAEVWRALDIRLGREVAVKRLRVDLATDPTFQARFRREAQSAAGLNHPNIVSTYDTGEDVDDKTGIAVPYIVMELVEGHTLRDVLRSGDPIPADKAFEWVQGVLDALGQSHKSGIIHRDIKPANVMLTPTGRVKVMDFGIARAVADTSATMTQTAAVIGTAQYLSPEQARGETVDSRSDVYSSGCLLYELLVGRPPFVGDSPVSVAYQHVREEPVPPSTLDPKITPAMDAVVLKSLAKDPSARYQSAKEMRDDIARLLAGQPVLAPLPSPQEQAGVVPAGPPTAPTQVVAPGSTAAPVEPVADEEPADQEVVVDEEEPERRRSPIGWLIAALLAALLVLGGITAYVFLRNPADPDMAQVPTVIGQNEQAATSELATAGFRVTPKHVNGDAATENQVTDQDPLPGQEARKGSVVTIEINDGPVTNKIPTAITGMTVSDARRELVEAGFPEGNISVRKASPDQEKEHLDFTRGQVVTSNPAPGADVVPATQKVVLFEATGESVVPNLGTYTEDQARKAAKEAGFATVESYPVTVDSQEQDGVVQSQEPRSGTRVDRSTTIVIRVGNHTAPKAPETTQQPTQEPTPTPTQSPSQEAATVPNVTNEERDDAVEALKEAGYQVVTTTADVDDPNLDGLVVAQDPGGGTPLAKGSTVTLGIGKVTTPTPDPSPTASKTP